MIELLYSMGEQVVSLTPICWSVRNDCLMILDNRLIHMLMGTDWIYLQKATKDSSVTQPCLR